METSPFNECSKTQVEGIDLTYEGITTHAGDHSTNGPFSLEKELT